MEDLAAISIIELIELDESPIFVVDLHTIPPLPIVFNKSIRSSYSLEQRIRKLWTWGQLGETLVEAAHPFALWCTSKAGDSENTINSIIYENIEWVAYILHGRFRIVRGHDLRSVHDLGTSSFVKEASYEPHSIRSENVSWRDSIETCPTTDNNNYVTEIMKEIRSLPTLDISPRSEFVKFFRDFDWASTKLGPMKSWSFQLQQCCQFLLADPRPAALHWGSERVMLYNEGYTSILGKSVFSDFRKWEVIFT